MRKTPLRRSVLETLKAFGKPISVPELQDLLAAQDLTPNKTSLYRMMDKLKSEGLIEEVLLESTSTHYEIKTHHHHHFVCQDCERVVCLQDAELEERIHEFAQNLLSRGLKVAHHQFSFTGTCLKCA